MSILVEQYKDNVDKVWFSNSSNIYYCECIDKVDDLKELKVVFKNNQCYLYKGIDVRDYIKFKYGGLDGSAGKAFHKFIKKGGYEYEKLEDANISELEKERYLITEEKREKMFKEKYDETLESGKFFDYFPKLIGNWEKDKEDYKIIVQLNSN
jgi:hypothetical protein